MLFCKAFPSLWLPTDPLHFRHFPTAPYRRGLSRTPRDGERRLRRVRAVVLSVALKRSLAARIRAERQESSAHCCYL